MEKQKTKKSEAERLYDMTVYERPFWEAGKAVAGADEVGRGPLAGPVMAACVIMPQTPLLDYVNDSKKVSPKRREKLFEQICSTAIVYGIGMATVEEIDNLGIVPATKLAFKRAYIAMDYPCEDLLVDALSGLDIPIRQHSIIHGDALSYSIAAASIVAKVTRDRLMLELHEEYPEYGFDTNKGYGTAQHIATIKQIGACEVHRKRFIVNFVGK